MEEPYLSYYLWDLLDGLKREYLNDPENGFFGEYDKGFINIIDDRTIFKNGEKILVTTNPTPENWESYDKVISLSLIPKSKGNISGLQATPEDQRRNFIPSGPREKTIWSMFFEALGISISGNSTNQLKKLLQEYLDAPMDGKGLSYISSGSSLSNRYELHKLMRGWKNFALFTLPPHIPGNYVDFVDSRHWGARYYNESLWKPFKIRARLSNFAHDSSFINFNKANIPETFKGYKFIPITRPLRDVESIEGSHLIKNTGTSGGKGNYYVKDTKKFIIQREELYHEFLSLYVDSEHRENNMNIIDYVPVKIIKIAHGNVIVEILPGNKDGLIFDKFEQLDNYRDQLRKEFLDQYVVQKFIDNPLLFNGKKCHLRPLVMVSTIHRPRILDRMRIYTAKLPFVPGSLEKDVVDSHAATSKDIVLYDSYGAKIAVNHPIIRKKALEICKIIASKARIKTYEEHEDCYHVLAPDILFDTDYNAYLLEINTRPAFSSGIEHEKLIAQWEFFNGIESVFFPLSYIKMSELSSEELLKFYEMYSGCLEDIEDDLDVVYQRGKIAGYFTIRDSGEILINVEEDVTIIRILSPLIFEKLWVRYGNFNHVFKTILWTMDEKRRIFYNNVA